MRIIYLCTETIRTFSLMKERSREGVRWIVTFDFLQRCDSCYTRLCIFPGLLTSSWCFWRNTEHPLYIRVPSIIISCCFITIINLWIIVTNSVGLLWWIHFHNSFCCHKCDPKVCQVSSSSLLINIAHYRDSFKTSADVI